MLGKASKREMPITAGGTSIIHGEESSARYPDSLQSASRAQASRQPAASASATVSKEMPRIGCIAGANFQMNERIAGPRKSMPSAAKAARRLPKSDIVSGQSR